MKQGIFTLIDTALDRPAHRGQSLVSMRGEYATLEYADAPHKPSSTGRVYVRDAGGRVAGYFPSVFGLEWVRD